MATRASKPAAKPAKSTPKTAAKKSTPAKQATPAKPKAPPKRRTPDRAIDDEQRVPGEPKRDSRSNQASRVLREMRAKKSKLLSNEERLQLSRRGDVLSPIDFANSILQDEAASIGDRKWASELLMPYMHQRLPTAVNLEGNLNVKAGVLVAPTTMTAEEWIAAFGNAPPVTHDIDVEDAVEIAPQRIGR